MLSRKYDVGDVITLEVAMGLYDIGIAHVVTDGKYVQLEKEEADQ